MKKSIFLATMGVQSWQSVAVPAAFAAAWTLPFTVQQKGRNFQVTGWTIDGAKPTGKAYYVAPAPLGNDSNNGLDAAHPMATIWKAVEKADVSVCYVAAGLYTSTYGQMVPIGNRDVSVIATGGRVVCSAQYDGLTWALDAGGVGYSATLAGSNSYVVCDASQVDANGDYTILTKVANSATVLATPGSWFHGSNVVWVRTSDDRAPDTNIRIYNGAQYACQIPGYGTGNHITYVENFDFEGGPNGGMVQNIATSIPAVYFNNCSFKYGKASGLRSDGCITYCYNCTAARNTNDGFTYKSLNSVVSFAAEINCIGRNSITTTGQTDNGSTSHEGARIVRIMGEYFSTYGPVIHDIDDGTLTWNLGVKAHDAIAVSDSNKVNFQVGTQPTGDTAVMWLDTCTSSNTPAGGAIRANVGNTIYIRNFTGSQVNAGGGTVTAY